MFLKNFPAIKLTNPTIPLRSAKKKAEEQRKDVKGFDLSMSHPPPCHLRCGRKGATGSVEENQEFRT